MIHYNSLWETMSNKHFTTYTLREKHNIGHGTVQRLQKNMPVSTYTLDRLCKILDCRVHSAREAWNESCNRSAATSGSACVNAYLE